MEKLKNDPEWLEELITENNQQLRGQIVRTVRKHCIETGKAYPEVWHSVYERFTTETGLSFRECQGKKIDFVEEYGRLGELLNVAEKVCIQEGGESTWPWGGDDDE